MHINASKSTTFRQDFKRAKLNCYSNAEAAIKIAEMVILLTMAKECIPSTKSKALIRIELINGAEKLRSASLDMYQHHTSYDGMYTVLV